MAERRKKAPPEVTRPHQSETLVGSSLHPSETGVDGETLIRIEARRHYAGPIPSAAELRRYREVFAEAPNIIFSELQKEGEHRRGREADIVNASIRREARGQHYAFAALLCFAVAGVLFMWKDHAATGATIIGVDAAAVAALFLFGRAEAERERRLADQTAEEDD